MVGGWPCLPARTSHRQLPSRTSACSSAWPLPQVMLGRLEGVGEVAVKALHVRWAPQGKRWQQPACG
jgi:hypothetical protein